MLKRLLLVASMLFMFSITSYAADPSTITTITQEQARQGVWEQVDTSWKYSLNNVYLTSSWVESQEVKGVWYFLNSDGLMLKSSLTPDGYYVDSNGVYTSNTSNTSNVSSAEAADEEVEEEVNTSTTSTTTTKTVNEGLNLIQDAINKGTINFNNENVIFE